MFVVPVSLHLFGNNVLWGGALAFNSKTHLPTDKYYYSIYIIILIIVFLLFFLIPLWILFPGCVCQSVVNFISELQEQMCRFQKEINSKIREKKALETPPGGSLDRDLLTEAGEGRALHTGTSCDGTRGPVHRLEEEEGSSEAEQQDDYGRDSVGAAC